MNAIDLLAAGHRPAQLFAGRPLSVLSPGRPTLRAQLLDIKLLST